MPLPAGAPTGTEAWLLEGALFFGSISKLESVTDPRRLNAPGGPRIVILDFSETLSLDTSALDAIEALDRTLAKRHAHLIVAGVDDQPRSLLDRSGFAAHLGANLVPDLDAAVARATVLAGAPAAASGLPGA
jgi:SulP family sulfate permease